MGGSNKKWRDGFDGKEHRPASGLNLTVLRRAIDAIETLIECNGRWDGTKAQFAIKMGWFTNDDQPDRRLVEDICNLTRDQDEHPAAAEVLGGYRIDYAPSTGGMVLLDPSGELPLDHQLHVLRGDLQRQQSAKTVNRRRLSVWKAAGEQAASHGDNELARLCWQAQDEIDMTGFVTDHKVAQFFQALVARGMT